MIEQMARDLGLSQAYVESLARAASHEYKVYKIKKRAGGFREIHHPSKRLKALQRWLLVRVVEPLPVHLAALAYRRKRSILDNAKAHATSRYLLRMDLANFFPSITRDDIARYISERLELFSGWTALDIDMFCRLVCRHSSLTIGAPTSPALSNAICYDMDVRLQALAEKYRVTYTRYADDLFFSTTRRDVLREVEENVRTTIGDLEVPANLRINVEKTRHSSKRGARRVTGIVLGSDGRAHIGRGVKRRIRALIFEYDSLDVEARRSLAGSIAYATGLDPNFMNSLIRKYGLTAVRKAKTMPIAEN